MSGIALITHQFVFVFAFITDQLIELDIVHIDVAMLAELFGCCYIIAREIFSASAMVTLILDKSVSFWHGKPLTLFVGAIMPKVSLIDCSGLVACRDAALMINL